MNRRRERLGPGDVVGSRYELERLVGAGGLAKPVLADQTVVLRDWKAYALIGDGGVSLVDAPPTSDAPPTPDAPIVVPTPDAPPVPATTSSGGCSIARSTGAPWLALVVVAFLRYASAARCRRKALMN